MRYNKGTIYTRPGKSVIPAGRRCCHELIRGKKREIERGLGVFQNYIEGSELLDVVYSKKFGYVLLGLPAADSIDDSDVTRLEDPETLVKEIYQNLAYDFMEQEGHSEDYTEATNLEKRAMREWMKEYTDQLPEYNYLLDELLG